MEPSLTTRLRIKPQVLACEVESGRVLLDRQRGLYFGLDPVAAAMWDQLSTGATLGETLQRLQAAYTVEPEALQRDLQAFTRELVGSGLVELDAA